MPFDAGVRREDDIDIMRCQQIFQKVRGGRRFPKKFVHAPRTAVAKQQAILAQRHAALRRQILQPSAMDGARVGKCVSVAEPREVIVARIGVAALAIGAIVADRVVVVALNALHIVFAQQREDAVGMRTERP